MIRRRRESSPTSPRTQVPFDKLRFVDFPEIPLGGCEVTEMPFRYLTDEAGRPPAALVLLCSCWLMVKKVCRRKLGNMLVIKCGDNRTLPHRRPQACLRTNDHIHINLQL